MELTWAQAAIQKLVKGEAAKVRPKDYSMTGKVNYGDLVTLEPCEPHTLEVGDIVLVRVKGHIYLHLIREKNGLRFLIGNNRGLVTGWVGANAIYGKAARIER
jgi:hypothetical protein